MVYFANNLRRTKALSAPPADILYYNYLFGKTMQLFSSILYPHRASSLVQSMEQSPRTVLPLAAAEDRRREIRLEFHDQIQRLRALEKITQNLLTTGEIFENLEHDVGWHFKQEPELLRDIAEVRGKVASIVKQLNPEMDAMTNALWNRLTC